MRKVLVFQHVAHEILGTLNPLLKKRGHRIRYVNFERHPDLRPSIDKYAGLIILGGYMGVYEADRYSHIKVEMELIEKALKKGIPILGICLGAQMLAHALGAPVRKAPQAEIGWHKITLTEAGIADGVLKKLSEAERVFQMHGDEFEIPKAAEHLAFSGACQGQAFRYGSNVYGFQFHLEVDLAMIERWFNNPRQVAGLNLSEQAQLVERVRIETGDYLKRSEEASRQVFLEFLKLMGHFERREFLGSGHGNAKS